MQKQNKNIHNIYENMLNEEKKNRNSNININIQQICFYLLTFLFQIQFDLIC